MPDPTIAMSKPRGPFAPWTSSHVLHANRAMASIEKDVVWVSNRDGSRESLVAVSRWRATPHVSFSYLSLDASVLGGGDDTKTTDPPLRLPLPRVHLLGRQSPSLVSEGREWHLGQSHCG